MSKRNDTPKAAITETVKKFGDGSETRSQTEAPVPVNDLVPVATEGGDEDGAKKAVEEGRSGEVVDSTVEVTEVDAEADPSVADDVPVSEADQAIAGVKDSEGYGGYDGRSEMSKIRPADAAPVWTSADEQREMLTKGQGGLADSQAREALRNLAQAVANESIK